MESTTWESVCEPDECCPPSTELEALPVDEAQQNEALAALAKALGHPARVAIMRLLLRRTSCVCGEIVDELPLAQSTVSQHLKLLKDAGLIRGTIDGARICYCADEGAMRRVSGLIGLLWPRGEE